MPCASGACDKEVVLWDSVFSPPFVVWFFGFLGSRWEPEWGVISHFCARDEVEMAIGSSQICQNPNSNSNRKILKMKT